ncbi:lipase family protein [Nocardia cyriacigeorgica]|uniref:lipase family protein n=1 Tax=Nocardia cyriacigeorgica TaxID=135487 RepID=UPI001893D9A9|nr:lipase family protein [Nocardia cyriacigeorgica]MBF6453275.1 lipase [Nocardia cyriacigeorgica]MBF6478118.1 lipase [Nocardia cyriacigeorgica]MBF6550444.1 lipase [Nocardia cyriacigeorgica]
MRTAGIGQSESLGRGRGLRARITALAVSVLTTCAALGAVAAPTAAIPNTADAFYLPPAGYESAVPGTILRTRPITPVSLQLIPMRVRAWQLLYRTTDSHGDPYAAVTTVLMGDHGRAPSAILSYDSMIDAIAPNCMPSQVLQTGAPWFDFAGAGGPITLSTTASEVPMIAAGLNQGWAVSVPDLGGVDNHFLTPKEPGYVAIDGVRAAQHFAELGLAAAAPAMFWGYSGGGIATAWAAQVQPDYAPELNVAGMAIGAPVVDLMAGLRNGNGTPVAGLPPVGIAALQQDSPEFAAMMDRVLTAEGKRLLAGAAASCTPQNLVSFPFRDFGTLLTVPLEQVLNAPLTQQLIAERTLGATAPAAPVYLYNAVDDELSTIASSDQLVDKYCAAGIAVTYRRDVVPSAVSPHAFEWGLGAPAAFAWLKDRAAGRPLAGCDVQTGTTPTTPAAMNAFGADFVGGMLAAILGHR